MRDLQDLFLGSWALTAASTSFFNISINVSSCEGSASGFTAEGFERPELEEIRDSPVGLPPEDVVVSHFVPTHLVFVITDLPLGFSESPLDVTGRPLEGAELNVEFTTLPFRDAELMFEFWELIFKFVEVTLGAEVFFVSQFAPTHLVSELCVEQVASRHEDSVVVVADCQIH